MAAVLTPVAGILRRGDTARAGRAVADAVSASVRPEGVLLLLGLASRAGYCLYATVVVAINLPGYQRPGLAVAALALALLASAGLGLRAWRDHAFSGLAAAGDTAAGLGVLVLLAAALRQPDRYGSLNWALTYAVACAAWLGLGGRLSRRIWPACALGVAYGVTTLHGGAVTPAPTVTAMVNAASVPMYCAIAATVTWVVRRIAAEIAARQALERVQRRDLAALAERERLVGEVHRSVLGTLEEIASGRAPWAESRGLAGAQVGELRQAFGQQPGAAAGGGLRGLLAALARDRAGDGWRIGVIDDELADEPGPAAARALRDALAELVAGPGPDGCPAVRAQVRPAGRGTELLIRIPRDEQAMADPLARAQARLAPAAGQATLMPARSDEVRVLLRVPA